MTFRFARPTKHDSAPDVVSGLVLRHVKLWAIQPEATTNLVRNPSVETNTTDYNAVGSTITRVATQQRRGAYSLQVTPTIPGAGGVWYGNITLTSGTTYTFSVDVKGKAGIWYQVYIGDGSGNILGTQYRFRATGQWQRVSVTYKETSTQQRKFFIYKDPQSITNQDTFYVDGLQVEAKAYATTYCDGDQQGTVVQSPPAYQWQGLPHASTSSRRADARHGGKVVALEDTGLQLTGIAGLGMAPPTPITSPYALADGSNYQRTLFQGRTITIAGVIHGSGATDTARKKQALTDLLNRDAAADQPIRFLLQLQTPTGNPVTDLLEFQAVYAGGLEGSIVNPYQESITITLALVNPLLQSSFEVGAALNAPQTASSSLVKRAGPHQYTTLASLNAGGIIYAMAYNPFDGRLYVGGEFTSPGTRLIAIDLKDNSVVTFGTGANGTVYALEIEKDGTVAIGGAFTTLNGVAAARIGYYTLGTGLFSQLGSGANGTVYTILRDPATDIMIFGGAFTTFNGATSQRIASYTNHATLTAYNPGANDEVRALTAGRVNPFFPPTAIFIGGFFTTFMGISSNYLIQSDTSSGGLAATPTAIGTTGLSDATYSLETDKRGLVYVGGRAFTFNGTSLSHGVMTWNDSSDTMSSVGNGLEVAGGAFQVEAIASDSQNNIYLGGTFTSLYLTSVTNEASSQIIVGGLTLYNKSSITLFESIVSAVYDLYLDSADNLYFGLTNTSTIGTKTTVTNTGSAKTYPRLRVKVTSNTNGCLIVINATTGKMFVLRGNHFDSATEYWYFSTDMYIDFNPDTFQAVAVDGTDLRQYIMPQSNTGEMYLTPGDNDIYVVHGSGTMAYALSWQPVYQALSDAV